MAYTDILYGVDDFVATITLNRPDKLNAWTSEMDGDVRAAIERAAADDSVRAIVITGAGRGFCAGADMSRLSRLSAGETPHAIVGGNGGKPGQLRAEIQLPARRAEADLCRHQRPDRRHRRLHHPVLRLPLHGGRRQVDHGLRQTRADRRARLVLDAAASYRTDERARSPLLRPHGRRPPRRSGSAWSATLPAENFLANVQSIARELVTASSPRSIGVIKRQVFQSYFQSLAEAWAVADKEMIASFGSRRFQGRRGAFRREARRRFLRPLMFAKGIYRQRIRRQRIYDHG